MTGEAGEAVFFGPSSVLARSRGLLATTSTASKVAGIIREHVIDGDFLPGARLPEESISRALGVSRSTLREAFQQLIRQRLLVHELNRGVFVRRLDRADVIDLYRVRQIVECAAIRDCVHVPAQSLRGMQEAIESGHEASAREGWREVGAASIRFHQAIVGLAESERLDEIMRQVLAEFRLAYASMTDPGSYHQPFLARHTAIFEAVRAGDLTEAERLLNRYLADAENDVLVVFP